MRECPFCGYDEGWVHETTYKEPKKYKVICKVCGGEGPVAGSAVKAEEKWNGSLANLEEEEFRIALKEEAMGGVSTPAATLTNTPGVGTAQPASMSATTGGQQYDTSAIGSGDKWGEDKTPKKKTTKKHKIDTVEQYASKVKIKTGLTR